MRKRADDFTIAAGKIARTAASVIGEAVGRDTPVDTGAARSNWIMSIDEIAGFTIPPYVPYPKTHDDIYAYHASERGAGRTHVVQLGRKDEEANLAAMLSQHFTAIQRFDAARNGTIYLTNNLPYIERLDVGYSPQTAPGFVMRAVEKGVEAIRPMKLVA